MWLSETERKRLLARMERAAKRAQEMSDEEAVKLLRQRREALTKGDKILTFDGAAPLTPEEAFQRAIAGDQRFLEAYKMGLAFELEGANEGDT